MTGASTPTAQKTKSVASVAGHEFGYPHGHLGHLSNEEEETLRSFKVFLEEHGIYKSGPTPSHDDQTLLRYLRARKWVIQDAYKQFKDTEEWRKANQLDVLYDTIDVEGYEKSRKLYPQWTGRRDRRGIPLYLFEIRHLDSKTVANYEKDAESCYHQAHTDGQTPAKLLRLFALYENLTRFAQPLCTELTDRDHAKTPITLSTNIVDVSGVSLRQFWNLKSHMQAASQLATAHYPETLDRIFIIGAPYFFSTVWGWVKRWFDPITVSKIFILSSSEVKPTLESFIDPKNIPKQFGGELDFEWGQRPNLDPRIKELATWENGHTDFPPGPLYWRPIDDGKRAECVAMGSVNKVQRTERVCTIPRAFPPEAASAAPEAEQITTTSGPAEVDAEAMQNLTITADNTAASSTVDISEKLAAETEAEPSRPTAVSA
ncbi:CRAL-TRIO domain-containing protein [Diplogelasinospora grovesii]|uniref:CRAL-TRIO domain-containing protein n=1 Tax=Diplogelasinospora grovesii TaxID=303347 RepID=A0AAN6S3F0_9PEZI|nr:CRAL-TRIO domain-containing protein [Diplogelasinospora grovesii]